MAKLTKIFKIRTVGLTFSQNKQQLTRRETAVIRHLITFQKRSRQGLEFAFKSSR